MPSALPKSFSADDMDVRSENRVLILDEPFRSLWAGKDPFIAVQSLSGHLFRELETRRTLRTEIADHGYFVKIHHGVGWREIVKNLLTLRRPVLGAGDEWQALQRLQSAGVNTMRAVAYGQRGRNPARQTSFLVTEELAPTMSLEDFCLDWAKQPPPLALKRTLIRKVAQLARAMHAAGVNHRDFYLCHVLVHLDPPPTGQGCRLSLIDLHRAQVRPATPRRWRDKDLAALYFSALDIGLTQRDLLRFLATYFDQPVRQVLREEAHLLAHLAREARQLQARFRRKVALGEMT